VLPVRRWHARQWHRETCAGSPEQLAVSCPHTHAAILVGIESSFRRGPDDGSVRILSARCKLQRLRPEALNDLRVAVGQNKWLAEIFERFEEIALPDSWLVAGCIAQTVWNLRCRQPAEFGVKDVDLIYFDSQDLSLEAELGHERRLRDLFRGLPIKLDVKNEARVHLWYKDRFGYAIEPYSSSADAIATFPTTATSVGIRRILGKFECCAPFGLDDLFGLVVRPNKRQITRSIYEAKVDRWRSIWPGLTFQPWDESVPPT
jgi:uncharacterized protein